MIGEEGKGFYEGSVVGPSGVGICCVMQTRLRYRFPQYCPVSFPSMWLVLIA